jgi:CRP/FNR family cyclic AMP-dependent transcriptional regulator
MEPRITGSWPFQPVQRGARISRKELDRRQEALTRAPLFSGLPKRHLRSIAEVTWIPSFREGATILKEGSSGSSFLVILEGSAKVVRSGRTIARLAAGDFFGEISLLDPGPRTASVIAELPTICLELGGAAFRDILAREPSLAMKVMRELARRLRDRQPSGVPA